MGETADTFIPILHHKLKEYILEAYCKDYSTLPAEFQNPVYNNPILPQGFGTQLHMVKLYTASDEPDTDKETGDQETGIREAVTVCRTLRQS